jgi:hypothetical protein
MLPVGQTQLLSWTKSGKAQIVQTVAEVHWRQPSGQAVQEDPNKKYLIWQPWQLVAVVLQEVQEESQGEQVVAPAAWKVPTMQEQVLPKMVNPAAQVWQNVAVLTQVLQTPLQGLQAVAPSARKLPAGQEQVMPCSTNPAVQDWQLMGLSWQLVQPVPQLKQTKLAVK